MTDKQEAATTSSGLGRITSETVLDGVTQAVSRKEVNESDHHVDQLVQRMAAQTVRRRLNRHGCTHAGPCPDEDQHRKDVAELQRVIQMLGLPVKDDPPTEEERGDVLSHIPVGIRLGAAKKPGDPMTNRPKKK